MSYETHSWKTLSPPTGIKLPVTKIANVLRPHGVLVMVDGAHGPGQIKDLEISKLGVDFYVASMHKVNNMGSQGTRLTEAKALRPRTGSNFPAAFISYCTTKKIGKV